MATEVKVPALGESVTEATVGQWLKKPGDAVALDEPIASLETDKVAVEVPSPVAGVLRASSSSRKAIRSMSARSSRSSRRALPLRSSRPPRLSRRLRPPLHRLRHPRPAAACRAIGCPAACACRFPPPLRRPSPISPAPSRSPPRCAALVLEHGLDPSRIAGTGKDGRLTRTM